MSVPDAYPLVTVVGPTGSGKSSLAVRLAAWFGGEVVNCDSVQVYAGLDIGSAKTPEAERLGVPHHLLDVIDPNCELTAGDYARMASLVLETIRGRGALPVIAGGTGFYLRALLNGLSPAPVRNPELRERLGHLARRRPAALHRFLRKQDAAAADRIHPNDHQKLMRAIELASEPAKPRQGLAGFRVLKIGLRPARAALYAKLDRRAQWMFETGLLAETEALLKSGIPPEAKAFGTLGYRQAVRVLTQGVTVEEAIAECQLRTRHYAKRQITWFRPEADIHWLTGFGDEENVQEEARSLLRAFL
jgi:tRNA dimethylallyltransferase